MQNSVSQLRASMKGLQALAIVARTKSISGAAAELGVTPSAVSHLVAELETRLAIRLLERKKGAIAITAAGEALCRAAAPAFETIEEALRTALKIGSRVRVSTISSFATNWLLPAMGRYGFLATGVDLDLGHDVQTLDLDLDGIDGAIRWGLGRWTHCHKELLFTEQLVAVASPRIVGPAAELNAWAFSGLPRIEIKSRPADWETWAAAAGVSADAGPVPLLLQTRSQAVQAAASGLGFTVVDLSLVRGELESGALIRISPISAPLNEGYWLVWSRDRATRPAFQKFRHWLAEAAKSERSRSS